MGLCLPERFTSVGKKLATVYSICPNKHIVCNAVHNILKLYNVLKAV